MRFIARFRFTIFAAITAAFLLVACGEKPPATPPTTAPTATATGAASGSLVVDLKPQSNSNQSGKATLTAKGAETEVVLALNVGPAGTGVAQPVHIHSGSCATLGGVVYPLTNLADGKSTTMVKASLDSLSTGGFAIDAHKSDQEISVYTACGDLPAKSTTGASNTGSDYQY